MKYLTVAISNGVGIDKGPPFFTHKIHGIYNGVELFYLSFPGPQPGIGPEIFLIAKVNIDGYFIAQQPRFGYNLAKLFNLYRICLCK
jgi:hypothetical protein